MNSYTNTYIYSGRLGIYFYQPQTVNTTHSRALARSIRLPFRVVITKGGRNLRSFEFDPHSGLRSAYR